MFLADRSTADLMLILSAQSTGKTFVSDSGSEGFSNGLHFQAGWIEAGCLHAHHTNLYKEMV